MSTIAAPATPTAPALPAAAPARRGKASDHLSAVSSQESQKVGGDGGGNGQEAAKPAPVKAKEEQEAESRLTKLAAERRKLDADRAAFEAEKKTRETTHAETARKAALWDKLEGARTQGKALDALRQLYTQDEIDGKVFTELQRDILMREPGEVLSPAQVQEMVDARVEASLKADREAEAKKREDEKKADDAKQAQAVESNRRQFLDNVNATFTKDAAKYPNIAREGVKPAEVLKFIEDHFAEHDDIPMPDAILAHFEAKLKPAEANGDELPNTVTAQWSSGAEPSDEDWKKMTKQERWEAAKRANGITRGKQ